MFFVRIPNVTGRILMENSKVCASFFFQTSYGTTIYIWFEIKRNCALFDWLPSTMHIRRQLKAGAYLDQTEKLATHINHQFMYGCVGF